MGKYQKAFCRNVIRSDRPIIKAFTRTTKLHRKFEKRDKKAGAHKSVIKYHQKQADYWEKQVKKMKRRHKRLKRECGIKGGF